MTSFLLGIATIFCKVIEVAANSIATMGDTPVDADLETDGFFVDMYHDNSSRNAFGSDRG